MLIVVKRMNRKLYGYGIIWVTKWRISNVCSNILKKISVDCLCWSIAMFLKTGVARCKLGKVCKVILNSIMFVYRRKLFFYSMLNQFPVFIFWFQSTTSSVHFI